MGIIITSVSDINLLIIISDINLLNMHKNLFIIISPPDVSLQALRELGTAKF